MSSATQANATLGKKTGKPRSARNKSRVIIEFPDSLLARTDAAAASFNIKRSELIRSAVEDKLSVLQKTRREQEMAAAYQANAHLATSLCDEFQAIDSEGF